MLGLVHTQKLDVVGKARALACDPRGVWVGVKVFSGGPGAPHRRGRRPPGTVPMTGELQGLRCSG